MMNKLERLERDIVSAKRGMVEWAEFFAKVEASLAELKAEAAQEWPKVGDYVYTVSDNSYLLRYKLFDTPYDKHRIASGNVHRTKEEAEAYREWLTNPRTQSRRRVEMCDGFDPMGECRVDHFKGNLNVQYTDIVQEGGLRFTTEEQAQACIDLLGEDAIKLALGVQS